MKYRLLLVILSVSLGVVFPSRAQTDICSLESVLHSFDQAVTNETLAGWVTSYESSDCDQNVVRGVQELAGAYGSLVELSLTSSEDVCSAHGLSSSFLAAALSDDVDIWQAQCAGDRCGETENAVTDRFAAVYALLTSRIAAVVNNVSVVGTFQQSLGCAENWQPDCQNTQLTYEANNGLWRTSFDLPAGTYEYKISINGNLDETYGAFAQLGGVSVRLNLTISQSVTFLYDHGTHWVSDTVNQLLANVPGDFQSEIGCADDWAPDCLRTLLQDPDGDGVYTYQTTDIPAGNYEAKVALNETWDENYGENSQGGGVNIPFTVPVDFAQVTFDFNVVSKVLFISVNPSITVTGERESIRVNPGIPQPQTVIVAGTIQSVLGCSGDWQPDCSMTSLIFDTTVGVWRGQFNLVAGGYEYKITVNGSWDENYGENGRGDGVNIPLTVNQGGVVYFCYDHGSHIVTHSFVATDLSRGCE